MLNSLVQYLIRCRVIKLLLRARWLFFLLQVECLFVYVAIKPIMIKIKVVGGRVELPSQLVNMYYGKTIFKLEGHFQHMQSISEKGFPVYFFHFKKQTPCSSAKVFEDIIDHDPLNETESVAVLSKMKENIFGGDKPIPGNDYYCPTGVVSIEWSENARITVTLEQTLMFSLPVQSFSEELRTQSVHQSIRDAVPKELRKRILHSTQVATEFCCFSGGGDICLIGGKTISGVIQTQTGIQMLTGEPDSQDEPHSPLEGELIVSGCIGGKIAERANDKILEQLVANMTVCVAKSLETMTASDLKSMKVASCYGLILDMLQPIQLYKDSMNFETRKSTLAMKLSFPSQSDVAHDVINKVITYMINPLNPKLIFTIWVKLTQKYEHWTHPFQRNQMK